MKIDVQEGTHFVCVQLLSQAEAVVMKFEGDGNAAKAQQAFWGYVQDVTCNWVKFYTIRQNGSYLFNGEFQKRTAR